MKWLFVTTRFPWPMAHGRWLRVYHLAATLAADGDEVTMLSFSAGREPAGLEAYTAAGVTVADALDGEHVLRGRPRCRLAPYAFDARLAEAIAAHAREADAVVLSGPRLLQYAAEASSAGAVLAEYVDDPILESRRRDTPTANPLRLLRRARFRWGLRRYERRFLPRVRATCFVSQADADSFHLRNPASAAAVVPNGVAADDFAPLPGRPSSPGPPRVVFTGYMGNPNNERAATFLARQVAPALWARRPDARVVLVGKNPSPEVLALASDRVEVTGEVPDIRPYLWDAAVVMLPMVSGTGIKNKLLEAWAAGAAVVATPLTCQGLPAADGENLLLAQSPSQLAERALTLMDDPALAGRLSQAGMRTVRDGFTWEAVTRLFRQAAGDTGPQVGG